MKMPRWRTRWVAAGLVAALALGIAAGEIAGWPFLRQPLQDTVTRSTGVAVDLQGRFRVHLLWRPRLDVEQLRIAAVDGFQVPYLLDAQGVGLAWRWTDLWRWRQGGDLRVQTLQAQGLKAHLVRAADGKATWQLGAAPRPADTDPKALPGLPRFGTLTVDNGHIVVRDRLLDVDLDVKVHGREGEAVQGGASGYEANVTGRYRALPLKLEVRAGSTLPLLQHDPQPEAGTPWVSLRVEGSMGASKMLFDGRAAALLGASRLEGQLRFRGPSLAQVGEPLGITLPQTPPFDLQGQLMHDADVWRLKADRATIGSSRLAGDLRYDSGERPPRLSGKVTGPKLAFADLGPAIGASKEAPQAEPLVATGGKKILPQRHFDVPSLKAMDADVQFAIDELDFGTTAMAPLRQLQTRVHLQAGVLRLEALQASVAGGQVKGLTQLDGNTDPARWQADLQFAGIDVAGWLRGLQADKEGDAPPPRATQTAALKKERQQARQGGEQPVRSYLTGALSGDMQVRGAGRSTAEILGSLDGTALLALRDGTLSHLVTELLGVDIAQALGVLIRGDQPLPLRCAKLDLALQDGLVRPRLAVVDNQDSTVWITGQVNLRDESLALRAVTRPKDWSPLSLRSPITVSGSLGSPQVGIEGKRLAGRVLGAIALGAAAGPAAALLPLVERGEGRDNDPCLQRAAAPADGASGGASAPATPPPAAAKKPARAAS